MEPLGVKTDAFENQPCQQAETFVGKEFTDAGEVRPVLEKRGRQAEL